MFTLLIHCYVSKSGHFRRRLGSKTGAKFHSFGPPVKIRGGVGKMYERIICATPREGGGQKSLEAEHKDRQIDTFLYIAPISRKSH